VSHTRANWCIATIASVVAASVHAGVCDKSPKDFFLYDTEPQARTAGVDYKAAFVSALGRDKAALVALLQVTGSLDGAGAQTHAEVLWNLLQCWGDSAFAGTLYAQSNAVRTRVLEQLRYATEENKSSRSRYRKTFQLSGDKTSNRRINADPRQLRSALALRAGYAER